MHMDLGKLLLGTVNLQLPGKQIPVVNAKVLQVISTCVTSVKYREYFNTDSSAYMFRKTPGKGR